MRLCSPAVVAAYSHLLGGYPYYGVVDVWQFVGMPLQLKLIKITSYLQSDKDENHSAKCKETSDKKHNMAAVRSPDY